MRILFNHSELPSVTVHSAGVYMDPSRELTEHVMDYIFECASIPFPDRCERKAMEDIRKWVVEHKHPWITLETGRFSTKTDEELQQHGAIELDMKGGEQSGSQFSTTALVIGTVRYKNEKLFHHFALLWHPRNCSIHEKLAVLIPRDDDPNTLVLRGTTGISESRTVWTF